MKQSFIYIILATFALVAVSCSKIPGQARNEGEMPVAEEQAVTFTADINVTKTTLGKDWCVSWVEGDEVSILWDGGQTTAEAVLGEGKVHFNAVVDDVEDYFAVYPAGIEASVNDEGKLSFEVPSVQSGKFEDCAIITAQTTRKSKDFGTFKSAVSLIRFIITDDSYEYVTFTAEGINSVTIPTPSAGTHFIAIPAGVTIPGVNFALGTKGVSKSSTPVSLNAGDVLCINTPLEEYMETEGDLYIDDVATLITVLTGDGSDFNGHVIHVKAGTYDLGASETALSLSYASPVTVNISGEEGTVFTTSLSGDNGCILSVASNANLKLDGITFTGASHNAAGGALCLMAGSHEITNCVFTGNACTSTTSDRVGGAIYVGGTASADIAGCTFTGNNVKITGGGALAFFAATTSRVVDCKFIGNNTGKIGNGGAILLKKAGGTLYVVNCTFDSNACATNGADIFASAGTALLMYNCTAVNPMNIGGNRGSVRANVPLLVANCSIAVKEASQANGNVAFNVNDAAKNFMVNNLILCDSGYSMSSAYTNSNPTMNRPVTTYGHNVYTQAPRITFTVVGTESDKSGVTASNIWSGDIDLSDKGILDWDGPSILDGFQCATATDVETAIKAFGFGGPAFFEWLSDKGIFGKDALGNSRGESWWPGAYQKQ